MKTIKIICSALIFLLISNVYGQSSSPSNIQVGPFRYLGFSNNSGVAVRTAGINRMWINPNGSNYLTVPTSGYMGIGNDPTDVRSRLTITGTNNTPFGGGGYRAWMKTGVFNLENSDNLYIGLKEEGFNRSDAVLAFGDDAGGLPAPRNNFRIMFVQAGGVNDPHLEIARYTANGNIGFGPVFGDNLNIVPQSLLHMNRNGSQSTFLQVSNQNGTGQLGTDGLKLGVDTYAGGQSGFLRWQENTPFIIQSEWNAIAGGVTQGERMRITSVNSVGVPNPANMIAGGNITRVAISHRGDQPITAPRSLLHLGYNTGNILGASTDGWRDWMDVGTFTSQASDNMYVGLKREAGLFDDRHDAVINWGDNQDDLSGLPIGPDNLRFIFTSTTGIGAGDSESQSNDGLEIARMDPRVASTMPADNYGMVGIGDWAASSNPGNPPIDAKLDIDGDLRIRTVTQRDDLTQVLVIDPLDENRVHWTNIQPSGLACWDTNGNGVEDPSEDINGDLVWDALDCQGAIGPQGPIGLTGAQGPVGPIGPQGPAGPSTGAHNGTSMSTIDQTKVSFGNNVGSTIGQLLSDREVPMNDNNILFTYGASNVYNKIGMGTTLPQAKFDIVQTGNVAGNTGLRIFQDDLGASIGMVEHILGANSTNFGNRIFVANASKNIASDVTVNGNGVNTSTNAGYFATVNTTELSSQNIGLSATVRGGYANYGARFAVTPNISGGTMLNMGIESTAMNSEYQNTGIYALGRDGLLNHGVLCHASGINADNYGIYASVGNNGNVNYAGYFDGAIHVVGQVSSTNGTIITSDQQFKTNINDISGAVDLLDQLQPRTFDFDTSAYSDFNFEGDQQMGLIAQEVENVLPTIVSEHIRPAAYDSLGNVVTPELIYKGVEYEELIPLLIAGTQEQQAEIEVLESENDSLEQVVTDLNDRLTQLENCLSNLLPVLCNINSMAVQVTPEETQQRLAEIIDVQLSDGQNIILNQNVPNPFAERTVITYSVPETVGKAQIHFYNGQGALINTVDINERGDGQINVFANDLSSGTYTYSLVADGKVVATKRMVKH